MTTTWLGIDFGPDVGPLLFETLGSQGSGFAARPLGRYFTMEQAKEGHEELVFVLSR